jgi:hypothetical protein
MLAKKPARGVVYRADGTAPIQNEVGAFLSDPMLNRILTAPEKGLRIR